MPIDTYRLRHIVRPANLRRIIAEQFDGNVSAFADRIGRPRSNIYTILRSTEGDRRGCGETLAREIERILGLDHLELDRPIDRPVPAAGRALTETERDMIERFRTLPEPEQNVVRALIESLSGRVGAAGLPQDEQAGGDGPRRLT